MSSRFTDIFIKRPVLASVVSLMILVLGLGGIMKMSLRQYPKMDNTTIVVSTAYPGASAQVMQGFITVPLEKSIASADGIDYMEATSTLGVSTITIYVKLNYPPDDALTEITGKVNAVVSQLPKASESPAISKETGDTMPDIILSFTAKDMSAEEISAYLDNVIVPEIYGLGGVSEVQIFGQKQYSMRIWLDSNKMAKLGVTPSEVYNAVTQNNVQAAAGQLKPEYMYIDINISTDLHSADGFNNMVVKSDKGRLIRIKDIGEAVLGSQTYDTKVFYSGKEAIFIGVSSAPEANPLTVIGNIINHMPDWRAHLPPTMKMEIAHDSTEYIRVSIDEVIQTIIEAAIIVMIVIFLFLGALRSVTIPMITVPLSLIGVCFFMLVMGFSLNLLTLLAMVLAIGLVVDDAIVVLENIYRHMEEGMSPFQSAIKGAREIANPVIVMTTTLVAVFAPIGFIGGMTGALFKEFAFTLAGAVLVSGLIALTLSPMMCSKIITTKVFEGKLVKLVDGFFMKLRNHYERLLHKVLNFRYAMVLVGIIVLSSCYFLFSGTPTEFAPVEDQGFVGIMAGGPSWSNLDYLVKYNDQIEKITRTFPERRDTFAIDGVMPNSYSIFAGMILTPWDQRTKTQMQLTPELNKKLQSVTGLQAVAIQFPSLPGIPFGPGIQFVLKTTSSYERLYELSQEFMKNIMKSGMFVYGQNDLRFDKPLLDIQIDRAKAGAMGINMEDLALAMSVMVGDNYYNFFSKDGYGFQVIPQVLRKFRWDPQSLNAIHVPTQSGALVPLSSLVKMKYITQPSSLTQFNQLNSTTIELAMGAGVTQGQAIQYLLSEAKRTLPVDISYDFAGSARQYVQEGDALLYAFVFALIIIYLVLSAQFESFRDPFIILVSVPMSICGALIPLYLGAASINIYTEIGLVTLIGLISKHGILMVEFANKLQEEQGYGIREAIEHAAGVRLRPILMTTLAMVFGVLPLVLATGAGAVSRHDVGLVILTGMAIGTCFTLFIVPTVYTFFAQDRIRHLEKIKEIQVMPE